MVLAILLLICAAFTVIGLVYTMATERDGTKRAVTLLSSIFYLVVIVLSAVALI